MRHAIRGYLKLFGMRFGPEFSRVMLATGEYLDRYILYVGLGTLRLHRFVSGDDKRAPHDHPWWFITFPFTSYVERYWEPCELQLYSMVTNEPCEKIPWFYECERVVKAWRFHFRSANFRHIVMDRADKARTLDGKMKSFWTFVISGGPRKDRDWGFWPEPDQYISFREWDR